jgi:MFS family permease
LTPTNPYESLKIIDFRYFLAARFLLVVALEMQVIVLGWQIYAFTNDPLSLGLIGLVEAVPFIITSLFSGYVADTYNRKKIALTTSSLIFLTSFSIFLLNLSHENAIGHFGVLPYYALIFVIGICRGFLSPVNSAMVAQIIPRALYVNSASWSGNAWQIGAITGPALGGLIYGMYDEVVSHAIICVLLLGCITCYAMLSLTAPTEKRLKEPVLQSIQAGFMFVKHNRILLGAISLDLFAVLFGGAVALLPVFAKDVLAIGPSGLGILRAAPFIGSVIMGFYLAHRPPMADAGNKLLLNVAAFGVCMILFALSTNMYLSFLLLVLSGAFDNVSVVIRSAIFQLTTPDEMRGRVSAVNGIFVGVSNEIGAFESGLAARLLGLIPSVIFGGCMTLLVVGAAKLKVPEFKNLDLRKIR